MVGMTHHEASAAQEAYTERFNAGDGSFINN